MRAWLPLVLLLLAGCSTPADDDPDLDVDCTGHRHATFAVAVPDADGNLTRLDLAAPRDDAGRAYYQLGIAPRMTVAVHMHQQGPEAGTPEEQVSQMHYESTDDCVSVAESLAVIDVTAAQGKLTVSSKHALTGTWTNSWTEQGGGPFVHVYLQVEMSGVEGPCAWTWLELTAGGALRHVVENGESFLVLYGDPSAEKVAELQSSIPEPIGRPLATCA